MAEPPSWGLAQITNVPPPLAAANAPPERLEQVQIDLANGFLAREFYDLALAEYQKYLEWFPQGVSVELAQYRMADCLRGLGRENAAREQYEAALKAFPKGAYFARANFRLGEMDWNDGRHAESLARFKNAAEHAESAETRLTARFYLARALIQLQRMQEAIPVLQDLARVEKQNPYRAFALLELARLMEARGQEEEARVLYTRALDAEASPILRGEAGIKAGLLEMKARRWSAAAALFEKARKLEASPEWVAFANRNLVRAYYQNDRFDSVLRLVADPKNNFPDDGRAEMDLLHAHSLRLLRRYPEAAQRYDLFLKNHPQDPSRESASYERLICLYATASSAWNADSVAFLKTYPQAAGASQIRYLQAERAFQGNDFETAAATYAAIPLDRFDATRVPEILDHQGLSLARIARLPEASKAFTELIQRFPKHALAADAYFQRGLIEQQQGLWESALHSFQEGAARFPKAPERENSLYRIALLLGQMKQYSAMREAFQQLAREYPRNSFTQDAAYWIGWSFFEEKKYAEALPHLEKARKAKAAEYGSQAASRIILSEYHLGQRIALLKEVDALPAKAPPPAPEIHDWLARQSSADGDLVAAERHFRKLLSHPEGAAWQKASRWGLAQSLAAQSKWKEAAAIWEAYEKDYPSPGDIVAVKLELARAYTALREFAKAQETAEDVLRLQPEGRSNAEARFLLGELMADQEKFADAGKFYLSVSVLYEDPELTPRSLAKAIQAFEQAGETNQVLQLRKELQTKYPDFKAKN